MPATAILDFDKLLAPITGDNPAGADLRADTGPSSDYYAVRDARFANRTAERQLQADPANGVAADWRPVLQRGSAVLADKAKDLEIAAFVIESLVRLHGFGGLRDGFRLARELIEQFWEQLYPLPDEDGLETRLAPLTGLNGAEGEGTLISPILCVPLTKGGAEPLACYQIQQALALRQVKDDQVRAKRIQEGTVAPEVVQLAVAETPREFFAQLVRDLTECEDEFTKLCQTLDDKCGSHAPPTTNIRNALAACRDALVQAAGSKLPTKEEANTVEQVAAQPAETPTANGVAAKAIATRGDAFHVLLDVADYFRRTEPHSVVSYGLEQVVRWGNMSLPALLSELITDAQPREQLFRQVGIRSAEGTAADA